MKITYTRRKFTPESSRIIQIADDIVEDYDRRGFKLTLRQLYYQYISRGLLDNTERNYQRLSGIISDARLAGLIDWEAIEDRTRSTVLPVRWIDPEEILQAVARQFRIDKWRGQRTRFEVLIEKEALAGVIAGVCSELQIPYLCCRGYTSQSEMWRTAMRLKETEETGARVVVLHLGDHDPSGIDMTRDIEERIATFGANVTVRRIALNMDQIHEHSPPPNPAKQTDARFQDYKEKFGDESWELDALDPTLIASLIRDNVLAERDEDLWNVRIAEENVHRADLAAVTASWDKVTKFLNKAAAKKRKL